MSTRPFRLALLMLSSLGLPSLALAHAGTGLGTHAHGAFGSLAAGFVHPFTGGDHLAAMVAVGLWSALSSPRAPWRAQLAFLAALLLGAGAGQAGLDLPAIEPVIASSLLGLGLLVATQRPLPGPAALVLVAAFAFFHGGAHGGELTGTPMPLAALAGMCAASVLLQAGGMGLGLLLRQADAWMPRLLGGSIAAFGVALLVLR